MTLGSIPPSLGKISSLRILSISRNNLGGNIPAEIGRLSNLHVLEQSSNKLLGAVPPQLYNISTLRIFSITNNLLSGRIPATVGLTLPNLTLFSADLNQFFGSIPTTLANALGLIKFSIEDNSITGPIPQNLGRLQELQVLHFGHNPLGTGKANDISFISSLTNCTNLQILSLSRIQIGGILPTAIANLSTKLTSLWLNDNIISSSLPSGIGNLELYLSNNSFTGEIPSTIGDSSELQILVLEQNMLTGQIPASLAKLNFISTLNLSYNMLEGEVPMDGIFANSSTFLALGNGKLCGGIKALNLSSCPKPTKKKAKLSTPIVIVIAITIPLAIVLLLIFAYAIHRLRSSKQQLSFSSAAEKQNQKLSHAELYDSTNDFSSENLIGEGKYGSVYKGVLKPGEQMVAVKVLKIHQHGAHKSFLAECVALRNIRHRNLVKIITSCSSLDFKHNDFKALIFKYVPNGILENWLHPRSAEEEGQSLMKLQLIQRLNIAIDVASVLDYLHNHCGTPIIHCDIKPSNIFLGDDFRALVSDFGLAKFLSSIKGKSHQHQSSSVAIRGTVGYVAPEYGMGGEVSTQGDVYSYGILLLELFTGKRPTDSMFTEDFSLHSYVKTALSHQVMEIVDPKISMEAESIAGMITNTSKGSIISQEKCYLSMFWIGVSCSAKIKRDRMNIKDVLSGLQAIRNEFIRVINESQMR
ncbi:probable LRR receptor-like serine/threonine-protein kinase At3g47570 [Coffea eugenioides]|uniref:probable LRR receptor-like serine/threonine-protein kinase At3g47570 n=1 Tax=Coffea eugenioides TaxID=49369 RepID=UPI000F606D87|nr:probable LRR receptor-like serine/threonine-protein kinase At3g47570 [Coffea eugenioides]